MSGFGINQVTIDGNLTRDPELRSTKGGTSVCNLRIAHNERRKSGEEWVDDTGFYDVTVWKGLGEWLAGNLQRGDRIVVEGRLQWREWDTENGKRSAVEIVASGIIPIPKDGGNGGAGGGGSFKPQTDVPVDDGGLPASGGGGSVPSPADDDIPF